MGVQELKDRGIVEFRVDVVPVADLTMLGRPVFGALLSTNHKWFRSD